MTPLEFEQAIDDIYGREHGRITVLAGRLSKSRGTIYNYLSGAWPVPLDVAGNMRLWQAAALTKEIARLEALLFTARVNLALVQSHLVVGSSVEQ